MATPLLNLTALAAAQDVPWTTVNELIYDMELFANLRFLDRNIGAPPGSPAESAAYLLSSSPSGAWAGQGNKIAWYRGGAWKFATPYEGLRAWIDDENVFSLFHDGGWDDTAVAAGSLTVESLANVFIGTSGGAPYGYVLTSDGNGNWFATTVGVAAGYSPPAVESRSDATYVPVESDANKWLRFTNAAGCALQLPSDGDVNLPLNTEIFFEQTTLAGAVVASAQSAATVISRGNAFTTAGQYGVGVAKKVAANTWLITGDVA